MDRKVRDVILTVVLLTFSAGLGCSGKQVQEPLPGSTVLVGAADGRYSHPRWSPDSQRISFEIHFQTWVLDLLQGSSKRLTGGLFPQYFPNRRPDWKLDDELTYLDEKPSPKEKPMEKKNYLLVHYLRDNKKVIMIPELNPVYELDWDAAGKRLALLYNQSPDVSSPGKTVLVIYDAETGTFTAIRAFDKGSNVSSVRWDPRGGRLAYVANSTIHLYDISSTRDSVIPYDQGHVASVAWSPNGQWIAYRVVGRDYSTSLYIAKTDGTGSPQKLLLEQAVAEFDWSPDGKKIVYTTVGVPGRNQMFVYYLPDALLKEIMSSTLKITKRYHVVAMLPPG